MRKSCARCIRTAAYGLSYRLTVLGKAMVFPSPCGPGLFHSRSGSISIHARLAVAAGAVSGVDALLALQEIPDATEQRR